MQRHALLVLWLTWEHARVPTAERQQDEMCLLTLVGSYLPTHQSTGTLWRGNVLIDGAHDALNLLRALVGLAAELVAFKGSASCNGSMLYAATYRLQQLWLDTWSHAGHG